MPFFVCQQNSHKNVNKNFNESFVFDGKCGSPDEFANHVKHFTRTLKNGNEEIIVSIEALCIKHYAFRYLL